MSRFRGRNIQRFRGTPTTGNVFKWGYILVMTDEDETDYILVMTDEDETDYILIGE